MKITYAKTRNITRFTTYTTYEVYGDGVLIGYVENQKSGPYANWHTFNTNRQHIEMAGYTRKEAVARLIGE